MSDDDELDVDALLASTGIAAALAQHGIALGAAPPGVDAAALLRAAAAFDDDDAAVEFTDADLEDPRLLADLNSIGWVDEDGDASAHAQTRGEAARSRAGGEPSGLSAEEREMLALAGYGDDDELDGGGGAASGAASTEAVTAAEVDARIEECLREALACKRCGDGDGALGWLRSKKALTAVRAEAEAGVLERRQLPPRPGSGAPPPQHEPPREAAGPAPRPAQPPARPSAQPPAKAPAPPAPARSPARAAAAAPPPGRQPAARQPAAAAATAPALPAYAAASLGPDELEVMLIGAELTPASLPAAAPHTFALFKVSLPGAGDQEGKSEVVRASATPQYERSFVVNFDRRKGSTMTAFTHRRIAFELWHVPRVGVLRFISGGPVMLARAELKLAPLLGQAELHATLPLRASDGGASPGQLRVCLRLSAALAAPPSPPPPPPAPLASPPPRPPLGGSAASAGPARAPVPAAPTTGAAAAAPKPAAAAAPAAPKPAAAADEATDDEDDFAYAEQIASFEVLTWEIEEVDASRGIYARWSAEARALRRDALAFRKQMIEVRVDTGALTMEAYLDELRASIAAELQLARTQKDAGTLAGKQRAVLALKRVKLMKAEVKGAEEAAMADESESQAATGE